MKYLTNNKKIKESIIWFILYAFIGWFYEVFLEVVIYKWGYSDRGVLHGPYCVIYGVGAILFLITIYRLIKNKPLKTKLIRIPLVFIGTMLVATTIELIGSYLCELFLGSWPWQTYIDYTYNFQGRIALSPSIRFGLGGLLFLYILQPLFEKLTNKLKPNTLNIISTLIIIILLLDCIITFII